MHAQESFRRKLASLGLLAFLLFLAVCWFVFSFFQTLIGV